MKKWFMLGAVAATLFACNNSVTDKTVVEDSVQTASNNPENPFGIPEENGQVARCYSAVLERDTASLSLVISADSIKGNLIYNFYEKDDNRGMVLFEMVGDTLWGDYTFISEGMVSTREVVFLKKGDRLVEGRGEMGEMEGRMVFTKREEIKFDDAFPYKEIDCALSTSL